ncbi:hypothetical protein AB0A05_21080 [Streptomyces sp. NPDC046374]
MKPLGYWLNRTDRALARAATGISPAEYRIAVDVLERMTRNLEGVPTG